MPFRFDISSGEFVKIDEKKDDRLTVEMAKAAATLIKGDKGDKPTADDIRPIVVEEMAKIPIPKDGKSIDPADVLKMVMAEVAKIPKPLDGRSVTLDDVRPLVADAAAKIRDGKDGVGIAGITSDGHALIVALTNGSKQSFPMPIGKDAELKATSTHVMWRRGDGGWKELFAIPKQKTITGGGGGKSTANIQAMIDAAIAALPPSSPTIETVAGTTYTLSAADDGKILRFTSAFAITLTCPNNMPVGFNVGILQAGSGRVWSVAGSGATVLNSHGYEYTYAIGARAALEVDANAGGSSAHYILSGDVN